VQDLSFVVNSLRRCCNHPFLVSGMKDHILQESEEKDMLIYSSSKMVLVHKLLKKIRDNNEKVLILSQFLDMLTIFEDYLRSEEIEYVRVDGSVVSEQRQTHIDRFQSDPNCMVFLMSTKIGQGINLTAANHVILFDSSYNPSDDSQAAARCVRIGQNKKVFVYRLITKDSYEQCIIASASKKLGKEKIILQDTMTDSENISSIQLRQMIQYGVYHMFLVESESSQRDADLVNTDIESILKESHRIEMDNENNGLMVNTLNAITGSEISPPNTSSEEAIRSAFFIPVGM